MKKERKTVTLPRLQQNTGQIDWLPKNPRQWTQTDIDRTVKSIEEDTDFLEDRPLLAVENGDKLVVFAGNLRLTAVRKTDQKAVPVVVYSPESDEDEETIKRRALKDNGSFGSWDYDTLANEWDGPFEDWGINIPQWDNTDNHGVSNSGGGGNEAAALPAPSLNDRFIVPPLSILDCRRGYWQARKRMWRSIIPAVEIGKSREGTTFQSTETKYPALYAKSRAQREALGISFTEYVEKYVSKEELEKMDKAVTAQSTSLFDPVLAEIAMRWFCPPGGKVLDPFGGEQTKGLVAGVLGLNYHACEIRQEQVEINSTACKKYPSVKYYCGDSNRIDEIISARGFDLCFTSPPYYDLEVYSKEDMSALGTYEEFMAQYENIFRRCVSMMADNAFLVVKIGEIRNKTNGAYRNFVGNNISLMLRLGLYYYNEMILVEPIGSAAMRCANNMDSRKVAKTHQNVLVFYKGDMTQIRNKFPKIEFSDKDIDFFSKEFAPDTDGMEG